MAIKLWGAAIDPWRNPSLRLPSKFREALCEVQDLLPSCSCTSIALVEHVLTTTQYIMKCPAHFKTPRRSEEGKEAIRVRQEKAKALRAETSGKPAPKPSTPPPPPPVSGQYDQFLPEDPTVSREWVLDCGCSFEMAVWAFFSWKNLWGQNTGNGAWQRMPHIPVYPREFLFQNLTNFAMVDIQHVMNWRGTGFWDRRFHIRFRKNQLVRMEMLLDELEALPSFDDPDIRGWPDVKSRMNACGALNLHRVKVEVEDSA
ncbi:hypothetical protein BDN72DRAFT_901189 [Pluteus cervinus]|uniref:Uncharacterized protein n=1 Tax=Pluteus cervinus TaxID=181527 RepID=A0ACD3AGS4_9AGAR|nr:hypothetical protein BDN72DRAFT_901189 [Pluteus cervinus]